MYNIGTKIKELRRGREMTQEQLADLLQISFQAVSKWERGESLPDLTMAARLARLFDITTDELLGLTNTVKDQRREELDFACENGWKTMEVDDELKLAQEAVAEYPGNLRYLGWLGELHFKHAWYHDSSEDVKAEFEAGEKCCRTVIEYTNDADLKYSAIHTLVLTLNNLKRHDEARHYAEMLLEDKRNWRTWRKKMIADNTPGEDGIALKQQIVLDQMNDLDMAIADLSWPKAVDEAVICDLRQSIIEMMIPDGNYLWYWWKLMLIHSERAELYTARGQYTDAVAELRETLKCGIAFDKTFLGNHDVYKYTSPVFDRVTVDSNDLDINKYSTDGGIKTVINILGYRFYDPIRDREDFKALADEAKENADRLREI